MKYLTFLDYSTFEVTGKNMEAKIEEKDKEIQEMKMKYDRDLSIMNDAIKEMQELFNNSDKLKEISKPIHRR